MLERLNKKLEHPYQLKASVKRGVNQFLEMELKTENWKLSEEKIREAKHYDGYYAVITNNLDLSSLLGMPSLRKNMTLTQFRSSTKLDLTKNLK